MTVPLRSPAVGARRRPGGTASAGGLAFAGVFGAALLCFLAIGAVLPVLPRYVHGPIGAGDVAVGVVIGAFAVAGVVCRPFAGRAADGRGRRVVLVAGAALMAVAGALYLVPAGVPGLVVARLVLGAGEGLVFTAGAIWVVDVAPGHRRGQAIGGFGLAVWTALSVGPILGQALYARGGYEAVWLFAAASPVLGALVASRLPETRPAGPPPEETPLLAREALAPGAALALANVGYAALAGFVVLHLTARGVGSPTAVFTAFATAVVGTRLLAGRLPDRLGARRCAVAAGLAEAAGLALVGVAGSLGVALVGGLIMGVGFSTLYPALALLVVERVPEARRGTTLGTFTAFFDVGVGLGAPAIGAISALAGYGTGFALAAACALAGVAVAARVRVG